jgi:hypothetical protein
MSCSPHDIRVLQASVDPEGDSEFRILIDNTSVRYITIDAGLYSVREMCFGPSLVALLPLLPPGRWKQAVLAAIPRLEELASLTSWPLPSRESQAFGTPLALTTSICSMAGNCARTSTRPPRVDSPLQWWHSLPGFRGRFPNSMQRR